MTDTDPTDPNAGVPASWAHDIQRLADEWSLLLGSRLSGGTFAHVFEAQDDRGRPCVLKVVPPPVEWSGTYETERDVLLAAAGRGYPQMYRYDDARRAMLLERLGTPMIANGGSIDEWIDAMCDLLLATWEAGIPTPPSLMTAPEKCEWFSDFIERAWRDLGEPCPQAVIDYCTACAASRAAAHDPATAVLLHGDAQPWNALAVEGGYKLIDPDPFVGEAAADLGVIMREWNDALVETGDALAATRARCARIAARTGLDPRAIWEWGYLERVATAFVTMDEHHAAVAGFAGDALRVAAACAGSGPA